MGYRLEVAIDAVPPLENRIGKRHWGTEAKIRRHWRRRVCLAVGRRAPEKPLARARVRFELWTRSTNQPDPDNLRRSLKPVLDGLQPRREFMRRTRSVVYQGCGVIANDRRENFAGGEPEVVWHRAEDGRERMTIVVEEVSEE